MDLEAASPTRLLAVVGAAIAVPVAVFAALAAPVLQREVASWDESISKQIHALENRETILDSTVDPFSVVLNPVAQLVGAFVVLAVVVGLVRGSQYRWALAIVVAAGGAGILGAVLKPLFERPPVDPGGSGYSFPSGHAARTMAVALALTLAPLVPRWRGVVRVSASAVAALTGIAVVYHEWHWLSDVLAGWCLAIAWVAAVWLAFRPRLRAPPLDPDPAGAARSR